MLLELKTRTNKPLRVSLIFRFFTRLANKMTGKLSYVFEILIVKAGCSTFLVIHVSPLRNQHQLIFCSIRPKSQQEVVKLTHKKETRRACLVVLS